jgi:hypothetical protein
VLHATELPQVAEQALLEQVPGYVPECVPSTQQAAVLQATELPQVLLQALPVQVPG